MSDIPKTDGRRNQEIGKHFEKSVAKKLRASGFPNAMPSPTRSCRDNEGVDIMNSDEGIDDRLPYNIQCKKTTKIVSYGKLLEEMPQGKETNVVIHRQTKRDSDGLFKTRGTYAILHAEDFYKMLKQLKDG